MEERLALDFWSDFLVEFLIESGFPLGLVCVGGSSSSGYETKALSNQIG